MSRLPFIAILLSSTALVAPAYADGSMDELKARLERAERENLQLKAERLERENLTMKAEALESENAKLRADAGKTKPVPVAQAAPVAAVPIKARSARVASVSPTEATARRAVNEALSTMSKDDPRREMTAKAVPVSAVDSPAPVKSSNRNR